MSEERNFRSFFPIVRPRRLLYGDASEHGVGGVIVERRAEIPFYSDLPDELIGKSSGERELYALKCALLSFSDKISGCSILYHTDSQVADIVCKKGSSKLYLHKYAVEIFEFCKKNDIDLCTVWIARTVNEVADFYSKNSDTDCWTTRPRFFEKISKLSGLTFTLDVFSNDDNKKCDRFYSLHYCPGTMGVNSLLFPWDGEVVWACPPIKLLSQTFLHMKHCKVKGVVILPEWISLPVWPLFTNVNFAPLIKGMWSFPGHLFLKSNDKRCIFNENFRGSIRACYFDFSRS